MVYPATGSADGIAGDHIIIAPPFNVTAEQIESIVAATKQAVLTALSRLQVTKKLGGSTQPLKARL